MSELEGDADRVQPRGEAAGVDAAVDVDERGVERWPRRRRPRPASMRTSVAMQGDVAAVGEARLADRAEAMDARAGDAVLGAERGEGGADVLVGAQAGEEAVAAAALAGGGEEGEVGLGVGESPRTRRRGSRCRGPRLSSAMIESKGRRWPMAVPKPPDHWPWQWRNGAPSRQPTEAVEAPIGDRGRRARGWRCRRRRARRRWRRPAGRSASGRRRRRRARGCRRLQPVVGEEAGDLGHHRSAGGERAGEGRERRRRPPAGGRGARAGVGEAGEGDGHAGLPLAGGRGRARSSSSRTSFLVILP